MPVTPVVPTAVTFVPGFVPVPSLGWVDSHRGLIVPGLFSGFTCFLFRQYSLGFPGNRRRRRGWTGSGTGARTGGSPSPTR